MKRQNDQADAIRYYRNAYFYGIGSDASKNIEAKLVSMGQALMPQTPEEAGSRAERMFALKRFADAALAYADLAAISPILAQTSEMVLHRVTCDRQ